MGEQTSTDRSRRPFDPLLAVRDDDRVARAGDIGAARGTAGIAAAALLIAGALMMLLAVGGPTTATPKSALAPASTSTSPSVATSVAPAAEPAPTEPPSPEPAPTEPTRTEPTPTVTASTDAPVEPATTAVAPASAGAEASCSVLFVGDSLGAGMLHNGLQGALTDAGCQLVWSGGAPGIEVSAGAAALATVKSRSADVVVVVLGYHNARTNTRSGQFPGLIDQVMKAAGGRLVVWPLLGRTPDCSTWYSDALVAADQALQAATARWPNLAVLDYPSVIGAHPEYGQGRCPHLTSAGYRAVALWLAHQVRTTVDSPR